MKKIYSIVLMAAMLLVGTSAYAEKVAEMTLNGVTSDVENLYDAFTTVLNTPNAVASITLTKAASLAGTPSRLKFNDGQNITFDLAGNNLTDGLRIDIINAKLRVINSSETPVVIDATNCNSNGWQAFNTYGVSETDPNVARDACYFLLGERVVLNVKAYGVAVMYYGAFAGTTVAGRPTYGSTTEIKGEIIASEGTGIATNGTMSFKGAGQDKTKCPLINIYPSARIIGSNALTPVVGNGKNKDKPSSEADYVSKYYIAKGGTGTETHYTTDAAVYGPGYAEWNIKGYLAGGVGLYLKSGKYDVKDAQIFATSAEYWEPIAYSNGFIGAGSAIIFDANASYGGDINMTISGETHVASESGYAIQDTKTTGTATAVSGITISSGEFESNSPTGEAITTTPELKEQILEHASITGGTYNSDVTEYLSNVTGVITPVVDENGKTTYVVEEKPAESDPWLADIAAADAEDYVRLTGSYSKTLDDDDAQAKYLVMQDNAKIIIPDGKKLTVGEIVMGQNTVIEVMAGGKLIITDAQGLVANFASNIVLHATEGNQSTFIMHPDVASNKHPKATVEFISKAYYKGSSDYRNQRFGIPTIGALDNITADHTTRIWGYFNGQWDLIGTVVPGEEFDASVMDKPFAYYQMNNNNPIAGTKVTMTGRMVGVADPALEVTANNWATFSNSFMADMNAQAMMAMFDGHDNIDATLQTYVPTSENSFAWHPYNRMNILFGEVDLVIQPMQAFIIKNNGAADELHINYNSMVWTPFQASLAAGAPRKRAALDMTTARIQVSNAAGVYDFVTLAADNQFSAEYENGYDAEKVMNNTLDLYTVGVKNLATMATDNLDNTVIGMTCAEAGEYTISFSHINGDNLTLIDRATGARIAMVEGNTYDFTVEAGEANRFEIVASAKLPTDIENTDAKNVKGAVYTITGQYVGSVENWNVLPAGVYVIDGVKCVK